VTIQASSNAELITNAPILERKMRELPLLQDVNSNLQVNTPQINVEIDRKQAAAHNVTIAQIQTALGDAFGSRQVSTIYTPTNEYQVILEAKPEFQADPTALGRLYIHSSAEFSSVERGVQFVKECGPGAGKPLWRDARHHNFFQLASGSFTQPGHRSNSKHR
jgi:multidrug efflux pump subunit AcrB